jgi:hypothetical protein
LPYYSKPVKKGIEGLKLNCEPTFATHRILLICAHIETKHYHGGLTTTEKKLPRKTTP